MTDQTPKIELTDTRVQVTKSYTVSGQPPVTKQYGSKQIIVDTIRATFVNGQFEKIALYGRVLKKDGTAGMEQLDNSHGPHDLRAGEVPEWAAHLCDPVTVGVFR